MAQSNEKMSRDTLLANPFPNVTIGDTPPRLNGPLKDSKINNFGYNEFITNKIILIFGLI